NHLDMKTKDILKQAIKDFNGTVIVVSHDREFLDGLVEKVYEFGGGKVRECLGGIYEFLEKKKLASLAELELSKSPTVKADKAVKAEPERRSADVKPDNDSKSGRKLSYAEQRERDKIIKRAEKKVAEAEAQIAAVEAEIAEIEKRIADGGDVPADIYDLHASRTKALENAMSVWELASMEVEELKSGRQ
ncbi:MAG: ABC transporter ATP-binding protein, partial [Muribaculaceae bacterium]|nr:ABC transporter ATP-binding protein [Muribaculaceae bacterium]